MGLLDLIFGKSKPRVDSRINANYENGFTAAQKRNFEEAFRLWKPLAIQGHAAAQFGLGCLDEFGWIGEQDQKEAARWYRLAADQGHAEAQYRLGGIYMNYGYLNEPKEPSYEEGIRWIRLAAEQEFASAQEDLGTRYLWSQGVSRNLKEAYKWLRRAANQGDSVAQYILSTMYLDGNGVPKDEVEGEKLLRLSALGASGNMAQHQLYDICLDDDDDAGAYTWLSVAVATDDPGDYEEWEQHYKNVNERDELAKKLSRMQLEKSQALVKRYIELYQINQAANRPWWQLRHISS